MINLLHSANQRQATPLFSLVILLITACQSAPPPAWQWQRAEAGLPRQAIVLAVAAHSTSPKQIWIGYYTPAGLSRSEDGGHTWTAEQVGQTGNPVFDLLFTPALAPEQNGVLWAATRLGLFQSRDGGDTWQPVEGLPAAAVLTLASDAAGRVYVGLDNEGIYAQTKPGSWEPLTPPASSGEGGLATARVLSLAVGPDGQQLYAGTAGQGVYASQDGGRTWVNTYPGAYVPNLAFNPAQPQLAVASLRDRLVRTQDGGQLWHTLSVAWAQELVVSLLWLADGTLGAGSGQGRLYRSLDNGDSWVAGGSGLPQSGVLDLAITPAQLLAATWTGLYGSNNGGESWHYLTPALGYPNGTALLTTESTVRLGTRTGLFRWQPGERQWLAAPGNFPPGGIISLAVDPANPPLLYAGSSGEGLYRSDDDGGNWQRLPALGVGVPAVAVDPRDSQRAYILAAWERVYETRDGGQTWQARWEGLGVTTEAISIAVDPVKPYVYVGADTGLYRSYDGRFWRLAAPSLADQTILALLAQPAPPDAAGGSVLYIGATRGIYRSVNNGYTVEGGGAAASGLRPSWGQGLENISVTALLVAPHQPGWLYAGTAYAGVYESLDWGYTWQPLGPPELTGDVVEGLAWGPEGELFAVSATGVWRGQNQ
jgi:photosystem II stability/assembly factor-like uncharacterized protein